MKQTLYLIRQTSSCTNHIAYCFTLSCDGWAKLEDIRVEFLNKGYRVEQLMNVLIITTTSGHTCRFELIEKEINL